MIAQTWFLHVDGEAQGPYTTAALTKMIIQEQVTALDFVWSQGLDDWTRLVVLEEFAELFPGQPEIPVPKAAAKAAAAKPKAAAKPAAKPVVKPKPAPVVVEEEQEVEEASAEEVVAEEEVVEEVEEVEPEPEPAPKPAPKVVAAKMAPKPVAKPVAKVAPKPIPAKPKAPQPRQWRVPIDATLRINGSKPLKVYDISEGGALFQKSEDLELGADVKIRLESPSFTKPLDMTGVIVREDVSEGKPALGLEFTRANPAHKRAISQYVSERLGIAGEEAA